MIAIVAVFDIISYFFKTDLPHDLLVVIITTLNNGAFVMVLGWWFGSSHSSASKDAVQADAIEKLTTRPSQHAH